MSNKGFARGSFPLVEPDLRISRIRLSLEALSHSMRRDILLGLWPRFFLSEQKVGPGKAEIVRSWEP